MLSTYLSIYLYIYLIVVVIVIMVIVVVVVMANMVIDIYTVTCPVTQLVSTSPFEFVQAVEFDR